jgi:myo-inositol-1(or 4)-monophosphatase
MNLDLDLDERVVIAQYIASNAGAMITDLYHKTLVTEEKTLNDFATELDKSIESMALRSIIEKFPEDGFHGEENVGKISANKYEWVVDPIDGTNNFVRGLPLCGFQLAILYNGIPVYALIHRPLNQEIYTAIKGKGAYYTNHLTGESRNLKVSSKSIGEAIGIFDAKVGKSDNPSTQVLHKLIDHINMIRVFGVAVFDLPAIADGAAEFLVSGIANKYDIAAGQLLIEEAGGESYGLNGAKNSLEDKLVIFSNKKIKEQLLELL